MRSEPEASPEANRQERSDCDPSTADLAGKTAVEVATRTAKASPDQIGGVTGVGLGEAKDTGCGERGASRVGGIDKTVACFCRAQKRFTQAPEESRSLPEQPRASLPTWPHVPLSCAQSGRRPASYNDRS